MALVISRGIQNKTSKTKIANVNAKKIHTKFVRLKNPIKIAKLAT